MVSYRHKGLELYALKGDRSKLHQLHVQKIKMILTRLEAASSAQELDQPGYKFHALSGDLQGFYSVKVSGNYRIIFRFDGENACDVDYLDYH
ncbi:type II toxin-antitoxin system RelE/ParE family toxin [Larkinella terrae]|uniref:type II toxin-antitoxin system RelE/ParE family toxin n=1 Tax=Larkinella terrae TaxID=2025311 RepID=UPI00286E4C37|nr:type II toxin-antitoxin system RelE/ParE family toxin [Larkinella terrae]